MAGRLPDTRRIRVVTAQRGEFRDLDGERESLETKIQRAVHKREITVPGGLI